VNGRWSLLLPNYRAERDEWRTGWERERLDSMFANIVPGDVVYDVGTEEGDFAGLFASWGARLVFIEPNDRVWPNVRAIWEANGYAAPLGWWEGFASNVDSHAPSKTLGDGTTWPASCDLPMIRAHGFSSHAEEGPKRPNVKIDTLVTMLAVTPAVITIDVEGAEMLVLEGAAVVLDSARPLVWVSIHDEMIRSYGYTSESVREYMALHSYRGQFLARDHESHWFFYPKEREVL
jgi:FkbM family methyltransferase